MDNLQYQGVSKINVDDTFSHSLNLIVNIFLFFCLTMDT